MNLQAGQSFTLNVTLEEGNDPEPAVMLGRVHSNNNGAGLGYAQVSAYSHNSGDTYGVEADDSGWYLLELTGEEDYTVQVSAEGYNDMFEDHFIGAWDSLYIDFYLDEAPQSRFFGYVTNTNGDSLSGARIYFQNEDDDWSNTTSDGSGYYSKNVYPGTYSIFLTNNDYYVSLFDSVSINENEEIQIDAALEPVYDFDGGVAGIIYGENGSTLSGVHINAYNYTYAAVT